MSTARSSAFRLPTKRQIPIASLPPKYVAIDGGPEFRGVLREAAKAAKAKVRLGSPGKTTITGLIERFWRTLDQMIGLPLDPPSDLAELEGRLSLALSYYVAFRPIYAKSAATPAERLVGVTPLARAAVQPPRGLPGAFRGPPSVVVGWLDPVRRRFPYLQAA